MRVIVNYHGRGPGGLYTFAPVGAEADVMLRSLFPKATRLGRIVYVEQRFALDAARALEAEGVTLVHAPTGKTLNTFAGRFTVDKAA